jgi:hypothetical protein
VRRRELLQGLASSVALPLTVPAWSIGGDRQQKPFRRRRPNDPLWPGASEWQALDAAVGGNLIAGQPLLSPCMQNSGSAACLDLTRNLRNPFFLGDEPAGTQVSGWLDAWTPAPSAYVVKARNAADVAAGVDFAQRNDLRLVVKSAGHSYQGTSNAADSLMIWTRAMRDVTLQERFVPSGCEGRVEPVSAVSAGGGATWIDLYHAVTKVGGRYVQGGGCTDVGAAGLIQSGGFGSFSKGFGTAASGLLEAEIVTADGRVRVVNACSDPELFWALKGGGGGSWGVVTRVTLRTHPLPAFFGGAWGKVQARSDGAYRRLLEYFFDFYAKSLFNPHWGEQINLSPGHTFEISMVCQGLDADAAEQVWTPFFDWLRRSPEDFAIVDPPGVRVRDARTWWDADRASMIRDTRAGVADFQCWWKGDQDQVGVWIHGFDSLWLPATLLRASNRRRLAEALSVASRSKMVGLHFNKGLAGAPAEAIADARSTATNPVVADAFVLAMISDAEAPRFPGLNQPAADLTAAREDARRIGAAAGVLRHLVAEPGSYVSESNFFNVNWQREFWGSNYRRLQAAKRRYDPEGLFFVHHGVGSEEWSADGFTRTR